jgi:hypothetical protein
MSGLPAAGTIEYAGALRNWARRAGITDLEIIWHPIIGNWVHGKYNGGMVSIHSRADIARIIGQ